MFIFLNFGMNNVHEGKIIGIFVKVFYKTHRRFSKSAIHSWTNLKQVRSVKRALEKVACLRQSETQLVS